MEKTETKTLPLVVAAVKFKWQKGDDTKTYDYFVPAGLELVPGDKVIVDARRGDTEVEVIEIKASSELASKPILRRAEPVAPVAAQQNSSQDFNF